MIDNAQLTNNYQFNKATVNENLNNFLIFKAVLKSSEMFLYLSSINLIAASKYKKTVNKISFKYINSLNAFLSYLTKLYK